VIVDPFEQEEVDAARSEAARVGGRRKPRADSARRAVEEAGGGEAEGFEEAEAELIDRASHGDYRAAHAVIHDRGRAEEEVPAAADGEADHERSSERDPDQDEEAPA
jgi:hypothetical protein